MIEQCKDCGSFYNPQTISRCPACKPMRHRYHGSEIESFMRAEIGSKKRVVNSFRRAEVSKYEIQTGKQVYQKL